MPAFLASAGFWIVGMIAASASYVAAKTDDIVTKWNAAPSSPAPALLGAAALGFSLYYIVRSKKRV